MTQSNKLTIDLTKEWARCGFHTYEDRMTVKQSKLYIESMLKWFYCIKKEMDFINDSNVLDVLSLAILFDIPPIYNECVDLYICKLNMDCIMRDVEFLCHFPPQHPAYVKLRDHVLLILLRSNDPVTLAQLPIDYLSRVLSSDLLFVSNEFHRYFLLKRVLCVVDPDNSVLRGNNERNSDILPFLDKHLVMTTSEARSQSRKRTYASDSSNNIGTKRRKLESGSASKDFEEEDRDEIVHERKSMGKRNLDDNPGTDKSDALIKLLKTGIYYCNMTFRQLSMVREDGIVDEDSIFRALWEKETLERIIDPTSHNQVLSQPPSTDNNNSNNISKAQISPVFRFSTTVLVESPGSNANEWKCDEHGDNKTTKIYRCALYSNPEKLPFGSYRIQVEAEVTMPHSDEESKNEKDSQLQLNCKFSLKPVHVGNQATPSLSMTTRANCWVYCFNKHKTGGGERGAHEIPKAVTLQKSNTFHLGQVAKTTYFKDTLRIDISVVGEILDI
jgi:hypothetical protein